MRGGHPHCGGRKAGAGRPGGEGAAGGLPGPGWSACCAISGEFVPRGQDREDFVEPRSFIPKALRHDGGGRHPHRRPRARGRFGRLINFTPAGGAVPHQRGPGHHGLRLARGFGGQAGKAPCARCWLCAGDGAFQMSLCELATVVASHAPLKIVVFDNRRLGMVREYQNSHYARRHIATHMDGQPGFRGFVPGLRPSPPPWPKTTGRPSGWPKRCSSPPRPYVLVCRVTRKRPRCERKGYSMKYTLSVLVGEPARRPVQGGQPVCPAGLQHRQPGRGAPPRTPTMSRMTIVARGTTTSWSR